MPSSLFHMRDVLDNLVSLLLAQGKVIARGIELAEHVDKRVDGKGIMLAAHAKVRHLLGRALVLAFEQIGLVEHLARVAQEGLALLGHNDTLVGALKDMHTHLVFEIADRRGNRRLRHKESARGLGDAAAFGNFDDISELLELHSALLRRSRCPSRPRLSDA